MLPLARSGASTGGRGCFPLARAWWCFHRLAAELPPAGGGASMAEPGCFHWRARGGASTGGRRCYQRRPPVLPGASGDATMAANGASSSAIVAALAMAGGGRDQFAVGGVATICLRICILRVIFCNNYFVDLHLRKIFLLQLFCEFTSWKEHSATFVLWICILGVIFCNNYFVVLHPRNIFLLQFFVNLHPGKNFLLHLSCGFAS
jgi:hypothetical protein